MASISVKGGDKMAAALAGIADRLKKGGEIRSGFLEGSTDANGVSNPLKAAINEFGAAERNIPPRPFMRPAAKVIEQSGGDWMAAALKHTDYDAAAALEIVGTLMDDEIRKHIIDVTDPELSKVTLMLRWMRKQDPDLVVTGATVGKAARRVAAGEVPGDVNTKPLIDSASMYRSVDHEITNGPA